MSDTSLDLIDAPVYEVTQVFGLEELHRHYALGWRCVACFPTGGAAAYILERPVR